MTRSLCLVLLAIVSAAQPAAATLSGRGLENVIAFARLFGYVRHFHPSDEAQRINWEAFAIEGIRAVEPAATPAELAVALRTLFEPLAPTARVHLTGEPPDLHPALRPPESAGLSVVRWSHLGYLGDSNPSQTPYFNRRVYTFATDPLAPDPAKGFQADLGGGVSCFVPVALYVSGGATQPATGFSPPAAAPSSDSADRSVRLAAVVLAWNVFQHFYPYFDDIDSDWSEALPRTLESAASDADDLALQETLRRLVLGLRDGHARWFASTTQYVPPLAWDWIEGGLVVTYVGDSQGTGIQPGDVVHSINGRGVGELLGEAERLIPSTTPQWARYNAIQELGGGSAGSAVTVEIESGSERRSISLTRTARAGSLREPRPNAIQELESGIMYVDLDRTEEAAWTAALPRLAAAQGIVFDLRGYPRTWAFPLFSRMTRTPLSSPPFAVPTPDMPDRIGFRFDTRGWTIEPAEPYLAAPRVFITDGRAISQAELELDIVRHYQLGEIVGSATAGTDGNVTTFRVLDRYSFTWTGMKVLRHDGSQFHGVGVRPTIPLARTRAGVRAGRDELLERAVELLKNRAARPLGPVVVNAASLNAGPVSPGGIVAILAPSLGPQEEAGLRLDAAGRVDTVLNEMRVLFDGEPAPLLYAGPTQVNAVVPYAVAGQSAVRMVVEHKGQEVLALGLELARVAPAVFTLGDGRGPGAIVNQDGGINSADQPAQAGSIVSIYATGEGLTEPPGVDGLLATGASPLPKQTVSALVGGRSAEVTYAGAAPSMVAGVMQVNIRIPAGTKPGEASVFIIVGGVSSQYGVTVHVK